MTTDSKHRRHTLTWSGLLWYFVEGDKSRELGSLEAFISGGVARGLAAAITVPFTIAKTRMEYRGPDAIPYKVSEQSR